MLINDFPLFVHHVVVFEQLFADFKVMRFDFFLRVGDGAGDHAVFDRHAFFHAQLQHQLRDAFGGEDAHEVVFKRQIEAR